MDRMQEMRSRKRPYFGQPYKMLIFLLYCTDEGFERRADPGGGVYVRVHFPTLRRMMCAPGHRMLAYIDFLQTRKYVTLLGRTYGYAEFAIPSPWAPGDSTSPAPSSDADL